MAKSWRNVIADKFIPKLNRVNIAVDLDRLLADDLLVLSLRTKGFLVVPAVSEIQVRMEYEKYWKMIIEEKEARDLLIVYQDDTTFSLPCDIFNSAIHFKVSFDDLFPKLSAAILKSISFELLTRSLRHIVMKIQKKRLVMIKLAFSCLEQPLESIAKRLRAMWISFRCC